MPHVISTLVVAILLWFALLIGLRMNYVDHYLQLDAIKSLQNDHKGMKTSLTEIKSEMKSSLTEVKSELKKLRGEVNGIRKDLVIMTDEIIYPEVNKLNHKLDILLNIATNNVTIDCRR
jgi:hypothetical protein